MQLKVVQVNGEGQTFGRLRKAGCHALSRLKVLLLWGSLGLDSRNFRVGPFGRGAGGRGHTVFCSFICGVHRACHFVFQLQSLG